MCRRWFVLFLLAVGLLSALLAAYRPFGKSPTETAAPSAQAATYSGNATPPPDPRLTFPTGYLNIHPEVRYVGDQACARCHRRITDSYRRHPMGRSLAPVVQAV